MLKYAIFLLSFYSVRAYIYAFGSAFSDLELWNDTYQSAKVTNNRDILTIEYDHIRNLIIGGTFKKLIIYNINTKVSSEYTESLEINVLLLINTTHITLGCKDNIIFRKMDNLNDFTFKTSALFGDIGALKLIDANTLLIGSKDQKSVIIYSLNQSIILSTKSLGSEIYSIGTYNDSYFVCKCSTNFICLFNASLNYTINEIQKIFINSIKIFSIEFINREYVLLGSEEVLGLWNFNENNIVTFRKNNQKSYPVIQIDFIDDNKIIVATKDGDVDLWELSNMNLKNEIKQPTTKFISFKLINYYQKKEIKNFNFNYSNESKIINYNDISSQTYNIISTSYSNILNYSSSQIESKMETKNSMSTSFGQKSTNTESSILSTDTKTSLKTSSLMEYSSTAVISDKTINTGSESFKSTLMTLLDKITSFKSELTTTEQILSTKGNFNNTLNLTYYLSNTYSDSTSKENSRTTVIPDKAINTSELIISSENLKSTLMTFLNQITSFKSESTTTEQFTLTEEVIISSNYSSKSDFNLLFNDKNIDIILQIMVKDIDLNGCLLNCSNRGKCKLINGLKFICVCDKFYSGSGCEINNIPCDSNPCLNNGTCVKNLINKTFNCECYSENNASLFYGQYCENKIDVCVNENCNRNGVCYDNNNHPKCNCFFGYLGIKCEIESSNLKFTKKVISTASIIAIIILALSLSIFILNDVLNILNKDKRKNFKRYKRRYI